MECDNIEAMQQHVTVFDTVILRLRYSEWLFKNWEVDTIW